MSTFPLSHTTARGLALAQAAESLLRTMGGAEAVFRLLVPQQVDTPTKKELGLQPLLTQDVAIAPVLLRPATNKFDLLISPRSLEAQLHLRAQTAEQFFQCTSSIQVHGRTLRIERYSCETFADRVYLYRIHATE